MVTLRHPPRRVGFVLLDAVAALTLLSVGVFVTVVFFRAEVREVHNMHERFVAILTAESEIERLRTLPYDQILVGESRSLELSLPSAKHLNEAEGTLTVREIKPGLKTAVVRIRWISPKGRPLHVEMASEFSRFSTEDSGSEHATVQAVR